MLSGSNKIIDKLSPGAVSSAKHVDATGKTHMTHPRRLRATEGLKQKYGEKQYCEKLCFWWTASFLLRGRMMPPLNWAILLARSVWRLFLCWHLGRTRSLAFPGPPFAAGSELGIRQSWLVCPWFWEQPAFRWWTCPSLREDPRGLTREAGLWVRVHRRLVGWLE